MGGHAESAEPVDIFYDVARVAAKRRWRGRHAECDVVPAACADLDGVDAQDARPIHGRIGYPRAVAVVRQDDELQTSPCRRGRDLLRRKAAVRPIRVNMQASCESAIGQWRDGEAR